MILGRFKHDLGGLLQSNTREELVAWATMAKEMLSFLVHLLEFTTAADASRADPVQPDRAVFRSQCCIAPYDLLFRFSLVHPNVAYYLRAPVSDITSRSQCC